MLVYVLKQHAQNKPISRPYITQLYIRSVYSMISTASLVYSMRPTATLTYSMKAHDDHHVFYDAHGAHPV